MFDGRLEVEGTVLIVDAGNTSIKWAGFNKVNLLWKGDAPPSEKEFLPEHIYLASVRSESQTQQLVVELKQRYPLASIVELSTSGFACGVRCGYDEPQRLGVDRWLGVLAAHKKYPDKVVVIDAGTAIKVDAVDDGRHLGGYIVPGLSMMESSLVLNTGRIRIRETDSEYESELPGNTGRAVREGCYQMALGFLQRVLTRFPDWPRIYTGGDGERLAAALGESEKFEANLVIYGAKCLGDELVEKA